MAYSVNDPVQMRSLPRVVKLSALGSEDTTQIQDAIDALTATGGGHLVLLPGEYTASQINLKSHVRLKVSTGATITSVADLGASEPIIMIAAGVTDCEVVGGGTITMAGQYTTGESRCGIYLQACSRVSIVGVKITECGGDGIYLTDDAPTDIIIDGVWCDKNRRQGISVVGANGVTIRNCLLTDTGLGVSGGTAPQSGIDVEPLENRKCRGVVLQNNVYRNNVGPGLTVNLELLDDDEEFSLDVVGGTFQWNYGNGITLSRCLDTHTGGGAVNVSDVTIAESGSTGIRVLEWASSGPQITITNPTISNGNNIVSADFNYRSHIAVGREAGSAKTYEMGNVDIVGGAMTDTRASTTTGQFAYSAGSGTQPTVGMTVADGAATGTIINITVTGGTWAGGDAAGVVKLRSQTGTFVATHSATFSNAATATVGTVTAARYMYNGVFAANDRAGASEVITDVKVTNSTFTWTVAAMNDAANLVVNSTLAQIKCDIAYTGAPTAKLRVSTGSRYYRTDTGLWYAKESGDDATGWGAASAEAPPVPT